MARYPQAGRPGQSQNRIYVISGLLVIVAVIALVYGPGLFKGTEGQINTEPNGVNVPDVNNVPEANDVIPPRPGPEVAEDTNVSEVEPNLGIGSNREAARLITEAMELIRARPDRIIEVRDKLSEALLMPLSPKQQKTAKQQLSALADSWLLSKAIFPTDRLCSSYKVKSGDRLSTIAKKFKVPYEFLMEINKISNPRSLRADSTIKVVQGPFHVKVYRSTFTMDVFLQNIYVRSYPVGLGLPGRQTPAGLWHVKAGGKMIKPIWTDPDTGEVVHSESPDYPLGSRWIELEGLDEATKDKKGFGIHGTKEPKSIGSASSRGCIRLHNGDAIKVYNMLMEVHSLVKVGP